MSNEPPAESSASAAGPNAVAGATESADAALAAALARSRVMHEAPEAVILRAVDVFVAAPRRAAAQKPPSGPQRWLAALVSDSFTQPAQALGLRSEAATERKLLYGTEGRDVDLRIAPGAAGWQLSGQVLGPDVAGSVELQCGAFRTRVDWNAQCEFQLHDLPAGEWLVVLRGGDWELALPPLQVPGEDG